MRVGAREVPAEDVGVGEVGGGGVYGDEPGNMCALEEGKVGGFDSSCEDAEGVVNYELAEGWDVEFGVDGAEVHLVDGKILLFRKKCEAVYRNGRKVFGKIENNEQGGARGYLR